jgi:hypothetical protein
MSKIKFLLISILFLIIIWFGLDILRSDKFSSVNNGKFLTFIYFFSYLIAVITIVNLCLMIFSYKSTLNKVGETGSPGIKGLKGNKGKSGVCDNTCGKKTCYKSVLDSVNNYLKKYNIKLQNKFLINKINLICHSPEYQKILNSPNKDTPNEKKLIDYIKNITLKWVENIIKFKNGMNFLKSVSDDDSFWDENDSPFEEIKKYDIWWWTEPRKVKRLIRKQCISDLPESDEPLLSVKSSNNYIPLYNTQKNWDEWGPKSCPYYQLGHKNRNTRSRGWCWDIKYGNGKWPPTSWGSFTWRHKKRFEGKPLSIYHPKTYFDKKEKLGRQEFYPLGSVWSNTKNLWKPGSSTCTPKTSKCLDRNVHHNMGPPKETLLVSGDVKKPVRYKKKWDSKEGCPECQSDQNHVSLWEPVPPPGYVCLGDVAESGPNPPDTNKIRCLPKKCVKKIPIGNKFWEPNGINEKTYKSKNLEKTNTHSGPILKPKNINLHSAGHNFKDNVLGESNDGYNLFRSSEKGKAYIIDEKCFTRKVAKKMKSKQNNLSIIGDPNREDQYSLNTFEKTAELGMIKNTKTNKKYFIKNAKDNKYFIKGYNLESNKFDTCLTVNDDKISKMEECNQHNDNQLWNIVKMENSKTLESIKNDKKLPLIKIKSVKDSCLGHKYNETGTSTEYPEKCDKNKGNHIWTLKTSGNIL